MTVVKSLTLLGFGSAEIVRVPTDDQGRVRPDALPDLDERTILILQAGNVKYTVRKGLLRFGFHCFNDESDVTRVLDIARKCA